MIKDKLGLIEKIKTEIQDFTDIAVIGLSGGVDSTVVATLSTIALGPENIYGIHMPCVVTDDEIHGKFNSNSRTVGQKLEVNNVEFPVANIVDALNHATETALGVPLNIVNKGNSRSRARMCALYSLAHEIPHTLLDKNKRVRVIGTGNLSEDFIGYDTKGGDALADIFPIGDLFKSEVYELADFFIEEGYLTNKMIDRTPSAGLWDGQTDESELGYTYNDMEPSIRKIIDSNWSDESWEGIDEFVWQRHFANKHKHQVVPIVKLRNSSFLD